MTNDINSFKIDVDQFKKKIQEFSLQKNLSILELEKRVGMGNSSIRNILYERSKRPRIKTIIAIADVLKCSIADLVGDKYAQHYDFIAQNYEDSFVDRLNFLESKAPWGLEEDQDELKKADMYAKKERPWYAHCVDQVNEQEFEKRFGYLPNWYAKSEKEKIINQYGILGEAWYSADLENKIKSTVKSNLFSIIARESILSYKRSGKEISLDGFIKIIKKVYLNASKKSDIDINYIDNLFKEIE